MLTEPVKRLIEFLVDNGLEREEVLEVCKMAASDERAEYTLKNLEELLRSGQELTREDALLATIPKNNINGVK